MQECLFQVTAFLLAFSSLGLSMEWLASVMLEALPPLTYHILFIFHFIFGMEMIE